MVSEHQFERMRMEIVLLVQIRFIKFPYVMVHNDNGNNQGNVFPVVLLDDPEQFLFVVGWQGLFKVACNMQEHIRVLFDGADKLEAFHQELNIGCKELFPVIFFRPGNKFAESAKVLGAVRENQQFVFRMKCDQVFYRWVAFEKIFPSLVNKYSLDKIFPQLGVMKPTVVNDRYKWEITHECPAENTGSPVARHS